MAIESVKDIYEVGDLVGFLSNHNDNHIEDVGLVEQDNERIRIRWESDGAITSSFLPGETTWTWVNFGPTTEQLRLFVELKYLQRVGIQWL